jgi:hypothetical protein
MKKGQTFKVRGENYKIIKEFRDSFLAISEFGFKLKTIPKLKRIK